MGHLEGNFTPVLYIGRKVPKGLRDEHVRNLQTINRLGFGKFVQMSFI
jgi:hypothetical protein